MINYCSRHGVVGFENLQYKNIKELKFDPIPEDNTGTCKFCAYKHLCRLDVIFLHVLDLLLVFLKKVFQAWRNVVGVERTVIGIAEDVVWRALIAADDDESLVESAIEYIEEGVAFC